MKIRGGGLGCVARFRLLPTHSLWRPPLLGRNLITVFSTVNTLAPLFCARRGAGCGRDAAGMATIPPPESGGIPFRRPHGMQKPLVLRTLRAPGAIAACDAVALRRAGADHRRAVPAPERRLKKASGDGGVSGAAQPQMRESAQTFPCRGRACGSAGAVPGRTRSRPGSRAREVPAMPIADAMPSVRQWRTRHDAAFRKRRRPHAAAGTETPTPEPLAQRSSSSSSSA